MLGLKERLKKSAFARKSAYLCRLAYHRFITHNSRLIEVNKFFLGGSDGAYLLNYDLGPDSVVMEVGGYLGMYSEKIIKKFNPYIYIFEPVPAYYECLVKKFSGNSKAKVFNFGLFDQNTEAELSMEDDGSSLFLAKGEKQKIALVDIKKFFDDTRIEKVDLISINIEGSEYPLLKRMLEAGLLEKCNILQVQFHDFVPEAQAMREELIGKISQSHAPVLSFPFVWEVFKKK